MAHFTDADFDLLRGALGRALASEQMDVAFDWSNPKTRAGGTITPLRTLTRDDAPCRELRVATVHPKAKSEGVYTLCRKQGRWMLAGPGR